MKILDLAKLRPQLAAERDLNLRLAALSARLERINKAMAELRASGLHQ